MPNIDYHVIILALAALYWVGVGIFRFFQWIARSVASAGATATPMRQAMAEAQQQQMMQQQQAAPRQIPRVPPPSQPPWEMPRQPGAGGPAVPWETKSQDFRRQEQELEADEPTPLYVPLQSFAPQADPAPLRLFETDNDLLRAIILQEALGPPLSRRR